MERQIKDELEIELLFVLELNVLLIKFVLEFPSLFNKELVFIF
jgi:hypothetical protein